MNVGPLPKAIVSVFMFQKSLNYLRGKCAFSHHMPSWFIHRPELYLNLEVFLSHSPIWLSIFWKESPIFRSSLTCYLKLVLRYEWSLCSTSTWANTSLCSSSFLSSSTFDSCPLWTNSFLSFSHSTNFLSSAVCKAAKVSSCFLSLFFRLSKDEEGPSSV